MLPLPSFLQNWDAPIVVKFFWSLVTVHCSLFLGHYSLFTPTGTVLIICVFKYLISSQLNELG
jgi:hypothetical protein